MPKLISFTVIGYWHQDYVIDEHMIPYFDMQSAKETVRAEFVRFGYKNFVLSTICTVRGGCIDSSPITSKSQMERSLHGNYRYVYNDSVCWTDNNVFTKLSNCIVS